MHLLCKLLLASCLATMLNVTAYYPVLNLVEQTSIHSYFLHSKAFRFAVPFINHQIGFAYWSSYCHEEGILTIESGRHQSLYKHDLRSKEHSKQL